MSTNFNNQVQSDNRHLQNLVGADFAHFTASGNYTVKSEAGFALRVILNENGGTVTLRNDSEVIGIIAADAAEGTYDFGVYCNNNIKVDLGATCDVTVVFD